MRNKQQRIARTQRQQKKLVTGKRRLQSEMQKTALRRAGKLIPKAASPAVHAMDREEYPSGIRDWRKHATDTDLQ